MEGCFADEKVNGGGDTDWEIGIVVDYALEYGTSVLRLVPLL
jgi:hypothetical protein